MIVQGPCNVLALLRCDLDLVRMWEISRNISWNIISPTNIVMDLINVMFVTLWATSHMRRRNMTNTVQALSLVEKVELVQVRFTYA